MKSILLLSVSLLLSFSVFSQKIEIHVNNNIIKTDFIAKSETQIYTTNGNINYSDISLVVFETFYPNYRDFYNELQNYVNISFKNQTDVSDFIDNNIKYDFSKKESEYYEEIGNNFIISGNEGIIGEITPIGFAVIGLVTGQPIIIVVGGIVGLGLKISAWSKIKKNGENLKSIKK